MQVQVINKQIREHSIENIINKRDRKKDKKPLQAYAASWANKDRLYDSVGYTIFIVLPTSGCQWATESGGCTMCSYIADSPLCEISDENLIEIFDNEWKKQLEKTDITSHENVAIKLFVSGSFLNKNEVDVKVQEHIFNVFSKYDNIKEVYKIKGITSYEEIDSLLDKVGLLKEKNKKVRTFSLGMKQRLMIACALVGNPDLLILDEPINGLDPEGIIEIRKLVLDLNKKSNITILISSHYLDELSKIATNYGFIDKGHIVEEISYEELNSKIREKTIVKIKDTDKLAEYLDDNNINYEKTGKEEITIYNKINIPKFITELNNNKIEIEDIKEEKDTLENYFLKLLGGENE